PIITILHDQLVALMGCDQLVFCVIGIRPHHPINRSAGHVPVLVIGIAVRPRRCDGMRFRGRIAVSPHIALRSQVAGGRVVAIALGILPLTNAIRAGGGQSIQSVIGKALNLPAVDPVLNRGDIACRVVSIVETKQCIRRPCPKTAQAPAIAEPIRIGQAGLRPVPKDAQADLSMGVDLRPHQISAHSIHPALRQVAEGNVLAIRVEHRDHLIRAVISPLGGEALE
ncbi:MAG: hypothetical protein GXY34_13485, partial [Syntrophomonadaceae bacterium]|nr:hypothetical protein [Syntrophomonadaceae bacterium]